MTKVWIDIVGARAAAKKEGLLTAGMVGVPVEFSFSPEWAGLNLLAVFRAGEVKKDYEIKEGRSVIPAEVMVQPGQVLCIGVEGRSKSGDLVIPTVWAEVGRILEGAYAANDPALAPTPSQYERFMAEVEQLDEKLLEALYQAKQSGEFDGTSVTHQWVGTALKVTSASGTSQAELKGEPGHTPVKGVDYYTEAEKQEFARQVADQFGDEVVYITIDEATRMASHDAEQIKLLVEAGKTVLLKREEKIYQLCNTREGSFAYFNDRSNGVYIRLVRIADTGEVIYDTGGTVYYDAVRCGVQPLTEEQKAQARENLGINGMGGADWNAAEGEAGHVRNRTHWAEKGEVTELPLAVEWGRDDADGDGVEDVTFGSVTAPVGLMVGSSYTVNCNGTAYEVVGQDLSVISGGEIPGVVLGNLALEGAGEDTGEPFLMMEIPAELSAEMDGVHAMILAEGTVESFTVHGPCEIVHKLDRKYLPDSVGGMYTVVFDMYTGDDGLRVTTEQSFGVAYVKARDPKMFVRGLVKVYSDSADTEPAMVMFASCESVTAEQMVFQLFETADASAEETLRIHRISFFADGTVTVRTYTK